MFHCSSILLKISSSSIIRDESGHGIYFSSPHVQLHNNYIYAKLSTSQKHILLLLVEEVDIDKDLEDVVVKTTQCPASINVIGYSAFTLQDAVVNLLKFYSVFIIVV